MDDVPAVQSLLDHPIPSNTRRHSQGVHRRPSYERQAQSHAQRLTKQLTQRFTQPAKAMLKHAQTLSLSPLNKLVEPRRPPRSSYARPSQTQPRVQPNWRSRRITASQTTQDRLPRDRLPVRRSHLTRRSTQFVQGQRAPAAPRAQFTHRGYNQQLARRGGRNRQYQAQTQQRSYPQNPRARRHASVQQRNKRWTRRGAQHQGPTQQHSRLQSPRVGRHGLDTELGDDFGDSDDTNFLVDAVKGPKPAKRSTQTFKRTFEEEGTGEALENLDKEDDFDSDSDTNTELANIVQASAKKKKFEEEVFHPLTQGN